MVSVFWVCLCLVSLFYPSFQTLESEMSHLILGNELQSEDLSSKQRSQTDLESLGIRTPRTEISLLLKFALVKRIDSV
jgi:hypothetical protein